MTGNKDVSSKPTSPEQFSAWLATDFGVQVNDAMEGHFEAVVLRAKTEFEKTKLWLRICGSLAEWNDAYQLRTGFPLLIADTPRLATKSFPSFIVKMYRRNVLENPNWPAAPSEGWWLPPQWLSDTNDLIRTTIRVKYLDGVSEIVERLLGLGQEEGIAASSGLRATPEGYYAAHVYYRPILDVPRPDWDTEGRSISIEFHVTTHVKDAITALLHRYYARRRLSADPKMDWQWDYREDEFAANYLGHILHYVEGMIMDLRDRSASAD